jgi:two-component system sensor histidine kinase KdpD
MVSLADVIEEVRPAVVPVLKPRRQRLRVRCPGHLPDLHADGRRLGQVLVNLLLNASKFSGPGTPIDLQVTRLTTRVPPSQRDPAGQPGPGGQSAQSGQAAQASSWLRTTVADRGPGLPPGREATLFEPFYRDPEAVRRGTEGVGLGLAIVRAIVLAHGGQVGAANRRGGGACFWFDLPLQR